MLRLTGPTGQQLEDTRSLDLEFAGAESNVSGYRTEIRRC
jgi:hypothetical protein